MSAPPRLAYVAWVAICVIWGTTYLGIRVALESFSPAMLMCLRYSLSGSALLIGAKLTGAHLPRGREALRTAFYGLLTIAIGTGALAYSEQWVPSGMASLFASLQPFWLVGIEALSPEGERLHWPSIGGMPRALVALVCGSRAIRSTRAPRAARHAERLTAVVVFPTPPF